MEIKAHLVPLKVGNYYEQILISFETLQGEIYPSALVHIDTFYKGHNSPDNSIYYKLSRGDVVETLWKVEII